MSEAKNNQRWAEEGQQVFVPNYKPAPLVLERGEGAYLYDVEGRRYLDLVAGIAVSALGHAHPKVVAALQAQAGKVLHTSNLYWNRPSIELAERISALAFGGQVFFCNSGAEANEAQIKIARRHAWANGQRERTEIISFEQSFHGRTFAALAATGQPKYQEGFQPLPMGFRHLPYGDVGALEAAVSERTAAILVEPIQGEGGVRMPPPGFLAACRRIATERGALLMLDEVQTGMGRTGKMFAYQWEGFEPDVMSLAKALGAGVPIGCVVARKEVAAHLIYGTHGTTFGGNPLACASGLAVLEVLTAPGFLEQVQAVGAMLAKGLAEIGARRGEVFSEVRGRGLLIGAQIRDTLPFEAKHVVDACRARGVLVHVAGARVLRLAPPLVLSPSEAREGLAAIDEALGALVA